MAYTIEQRDEQLVHTTAAIRYHCRFERAAQHLLIVEMEIDTNEQSLTLIMPSWTPGSYKIREFVSHQGNLQVTNAKGDELAYTWRTKNVLDINVPKKSGTVRVSYTYYANERTVRTMHINRWRAFIMPVNCLMYVENRMQEIHHVILHLESQSWTQCSTALSPVHRYSPDTQTITLGALNYDVLADTPIEVGNHQVAEFEACGAKHEVALVANRELDIEWLTEHCRIIVETEAKLFGGVPYDRYVFMVQVGLNVYGGLEHSRCSVNLIDVSTLVDHSKSGRLLALLCHEYFHTWNIKRIRPREYGPFDYINEVYSPMLWLAEGFTSYYDDLLSYRCGFLTKDEYVKTLSEDHLAKLDAVPGRFAMNTRDASTLAWVKLYAQSPDGNNRFPSYYLKGGIITLMLELHIIATTNGTKRLDDVMRELWRMYNERPELGFTEDEVFDAIERSTAVNARDLMTTWLHGKEEIDYNTYLAPFGLHWSMQTVDSDEEQRGAMYSGLNAREDAGKVFLSSVLDNSPAQHAGLSIDDEIIAVDGIRVTSAASLAEALDGMTNDEAELLCSCDGKLFTTLLKPEPKKVPMLFRNQLTNDDHRRLFDFWLAR